MRMRWFNLSLKKRFLWTINFLILGKLYIFPWMFLCYFTAPSILIKCSPKYNLISYKKNKCREKGMWFWQTILSENFPTTPFPLTTSLQLHKTSFTPTKYLSFLAIQYWINWLNSSPWEYCVEESHLNKAIYFHTHVKLFCQTEQLLFLTKSVPFCWPNFILFV